MGNVKTTKLHEWVSTIPDQVPSEVEAADEALFLQVTTTRINAEQEARVARPNRRFARQKQVLAVHWHPGYSRKSLSA